MSQHLYDRFGRLYDPNADMIQRPSIARAQLRGSSSFLLNTRGTPAVGSSWQADRPSVYQALPADADTLLRWLGGGAYPAGFGLANVLAIYGCDTASPLVDSLGLGPNLVAAGGPLTGRECVGLGQAGSWTSKVGVEFTPTAAQRFAAAGGGFGTFGSVPDGTIFSQLIVCRVSARPTIVPPGRITAFGSSGDVAHWELVVSGGNPILYVSTSLGVNQNISGIGVDVTESAWHCYAVVILGTTKQGAIYSDIGDVAPGANYVGTVDSVVTLGYDIGAANYNPAICQVAYVALFNVALTSAMRAAFWRHAQVPVPFLHARTNPLVCPIGPSRVACYSGGNVGQAAVGYDAGLVSAALGNPLGTGYVADAGETFEPIGSDNFYGNTAVAGGCARASVDGPSGMRDGCRVTMGGAWAAGVNGYLIAGGVAIAGASNVPWRQDLNYRRATVNTTARHGLYFTGDGGGPEFFTLVTDAASPVDWTRAGGTCTPVGAAHNVFFTQYGAAANLDDCDFGEPAVVKNRATAPLAWRRVGTAAAAATTTPSIQITNTGNRYYNPLRGRARVTIGGFQGTSGAVFLDCAVAGTAGSMQFNYNAGQLILRIWDAASALVAALNCGAVNTARHPFIVMWDSQTPIRGAAAGGHMIVAENGVILGEGGAAWVAPTADVTPIAIGAAVGVTGAARCFIELEELISNPGSVGMY